MAQYLVLIYGSDLEHDGSSREDLVELMAAHQRFSEKWGDAIVGGNGLRSSQTATTVRGDVVTDGPFIESKEMLGGYYLIEATDLDHALEIGRTCPVVGGGVEIRPVAVYS